MKKGYLFLLFLLHVAIASNAQLLYKVTGNSLVHPSYLFGTYHLISGDFINQVNGLNKVIESVDEVYVEIVSDSLKNPQTLAKMQQSMAATPDSTLKKLVSPDDYKLIEQVFNKYFGALGVSFDMFAQLKPAAIGTQLTAAQAMKTLQKIDATNLLDAAIEKRIATLNKKTNSLETPEFQVKLIFGAPMAEQVTALIEMCKADDVVEQKMAELTNAYLAQDISKIVDIMSDPQMGGNEQEMKRLIFDRNHTWVNMLIPAMRKGSILVAVGAGHLPTDNGLINLLRQAGYTVEGVK